MVWVIWHGMTHICFPSLYDHFKSFQVLHKKISGDGGQETFILHL